MNSFERSDFRIDWNKERPFQNWYEQIERDFWTNTNIQRILSIYLYIIQAIIKQQPKK